MKATPRPHRRRDQARRTVAQAMLALFAFLALANATQAARGGGGGVTLGVQAEPPGLDPTQNAAAAIAEVSFPTVYEGLVRIDPAGVGAPPGGPPRARAADGLSWRFQLRPGVRFHDGTRLDADAVRTSLQAAIAPDSLNPQKAQLDCISAVTDDGPLAVVLHLARPCSGLLSAMGSSAAVITSPRSRSADALTPVGTGPFHFVAWRRGDSVTLTRNDAYWGRPARLEQVVFRFIADPNAAVDALSAGDVDGFRAFPSPESLTWLKRNPRFHVQTGVGEGKTILALNNRRRPLNNLRVRRALAYAIDRRAVISSAMFGYGAPIGSHYSPRDPGYLDLTGAYPFDPAKARALLRQAGYPRGFAVTLKLPPVAYARRSGEVVAAELADIGVRVKLTTVDWAPWFDQVFLHHDFDLTLVNHVEPLDIGIYGRGDYYFGYDGRALRPLLNALDAAPDERTVLARTADIQRRITADAPNVFLFAYPDMAVWNADLVDLWAPSRYGDVDLATAHWRGARAMALSGKAVASSARHGRPTWIVVGLIGVALVGLLLLAAGPGFALRRSLSLGATLLAASALIFAAVQSTAGDPTSTILGLHATPAAVTALKAQLGLDHSAPERYLTWLRGLASGDLGVSWSYHVPVATLVGERLAVSGPLTLYAIALAVLMGFAAALAGALWKDRWAGRAFDLLSTSVLAIPNFWFGLLLVAAFGIVLPWFPAGGFPGWSAGLWAVLRALTLPAFALALPQAAVLARVLRGELVEALDHDYARAARAKGRSRAGVLLAHALPNSLVPVLTTMGLQISFLLAGGILVENVFFLPGLGRLMFQAIVQRDQMVVCSVALVLVAEVVVVTLLSDLACVAADPRLRDGVTGGARS